MLTQMYVMLTLYIKRRGLEAKQLSLLLSLLAFTYFSYYIHYCKHRTQKMGQY